MNTILSLCTGPDQLVAVTHQKAQISHAGWSCIGHGQVVQAGQLSQHSGVNVILLTAVAEMAFKSFG
jgi:hypothetical protein